MPREALLGLGSALRASSCYARVAFRLGRCCIGGSGCYLDPCARAHAGRALTRFARVALCYSAALQFIVANSDNITAFEEFKDRSKPLFLVYKKGAKMTVCCPAELVAFA